MTHSVPTGSSTDLEQAAVRLEGVVGERVDIHRAAILSDGRPMPFYSVAPSIHKVTGPSLTDSTSMCSRNAPRLTVAPAPSRARANADRKSTRLNSSH